MNSNFINFNTSGSSTYNTNQNLIIKWKTPEDIEADTLSDCKKDVRNFSRLIKINHPIHGLGLCQLRNYQNGLLKRYQNNKFNIIKSTRQSGLSTMNAIYALWFSLFKPNKTTVLCSDKLRFTEEQLKDIYEMYQSLPDSLKIGIVTARRDLIVFNNGSRIQVVNASSEACRGYAISLLIWDNCAYTDRTAARSLFPSVFPCISAGNGQLILTSANKHEEFNTLFDEIFYDACKGESSFKPFNIRCHQVPQRNENWIQEMRKGLGDDRFNCEYNV